jgi:hypothetical protein
MVDVPSWVAGGFYGITKGENLSVWIMRGGETYSCFDWGDFKSAEALVVGEWTSGFQFPSNSFYYPPSSLFQGPYSTSKSSLKSLSLGT